MNIYELAKIDAQRITGNPNEFGVALTITPPEGEGKVVYGTATKHHLSYDTEGTAISSMRTSCTFSEANSIAAGLNIRTNNKVDLKKWKVKYTDMAGIEATYIVNDTFPDEMLGLIVCILGKLA